MQVDKGITCSAAGAQSHFYQIISVLDGYIQAERLLDSIVLSGENCSFLSISFRRKGGNQHRKGRRD